MDGLGINLPSLITQFVNFGILLLILWIFLFKPLQRVLDERRKRIEEGLKASESAQEAAEEAKAAEAAKAAKAAGMPSVAIPNRVTAGCDFSLADRVLKSATELMALV